MKINDMYPAVLLLLLIGILIGIGLTVMSNMSDAVRSEATNLDNFTANNGTSVPLANTFISTGTAVFTNGTGGQSISSGSFTWNRVGAFAGTSVQLTPDASAKYNGTPVNVSYTYGKDTTAQSKLDSSITAIGGFITWFAVIVVVLASAIIIGIVTRSFSGRR